MLNQRTLGDQRRACVTDQWWLLAGHKVAWMTKGPSANLAQVLNSNPCSKAMHTSETSDFGTRPQRRTTSGNGLHEVEQALCNHTETLAKETNSLSGQYHKNDAYHVRTLEFNRLCVT